MQREAHLEFDESANLCGHKPSLVATPFNNKIYSCS
jgi:hypothetical protein